MLKPANERAGLFRSGMSEKQKARQLRELRHKRRSDALIDRILSAYKIFLQSGRRWRLVVRKVVFLDGSVLFSRLSFFSLTFLVLVSAAFAQDLPNAPSAQKAKVQAAQPPKEGWPRTFTSGADTFTVYQPQVDKWEGDQISVYCAVEVKAGKDAAARYGVVWLQGRTDVDKVNRLVTLDQVKITKVKFPLAHEKEAELTALLEKKLPGATKTISLDRLEAALDADNERIKGVAVKNDPPKVIISSKPSLLVLVDGEPQLRSVEGTDLQRVINTRSVILFETDKKQYYLRVQDWWLQSKSLDGPWTYADKLPKDMKKADEYIVKQNLAQQSEGEPAKPKEPSLKDQGKKAEIPAIYVVYAPAEMIETKGTPVYNAIPGTGLRVRQQYQRQHLPPEQRVLHPDLGTLVQRRITRWTVDLRQRAKTCLPTLQRFRPPTRRRPCWPRFRERRKPKMR